MTVETVRPEDVAPGALSGSAVQRREDPALLTGDAEFTDDIHHARMAHLAILRSPHPHARIRDIDASGAESLDGVIRVYTGADVEASGAPNRLAIRATPSYAAIPDRPMIATDRVRFQGDPVAAVVADDRYTAHEAAGLIAVEYERLDGLADQTSAVGDDAPPLHDGIPDNVCFEWVRGDPDAVDDAFDAADHRASVELTNQRLAPNAIEPRAAIARYAASSGRLTVEMTSQNPHHHQQHLGETLDHPVHKIRVRSPDVGGGFGSKIHHYPGEAITAWCAMRLGRPVKWQATRSEAFQADAHGRDHASTAELALDADGRFRALRVRTDVNLGAYVSTVAANVASSAYGRMLTGQYDIPAVDLRVRGVFTNTAPTDAYRGAGRPEASYLVERLVSAAARELAVDPAEIRRRNFIPPDAFPYETPAGRTYDSGEYERALDAALDAADYDVLRDRQSDLRDEGRYLGIGLSCYVESCGSGPGLFESGLVRVTPDGAVVVKTGTHSHGQGHATSYAQVIADELGVPLADVDVVEGDTGEVPEGSGTYGSRSLPVGGSAIVESARKVRERAERVAAHRLEADAADLTFEDGEFRVAGAPDRSIHLRTIAEQVYDAEDLPEGMEPGLEATSFYDPPNYTFPFGAHVAVVEVDPATGAVEFERFVAVDDCGEQVNPKIVEGQIHGGIAQGIGQALYEHAVYDDRGTLQAGSLLDYALPRAGHVPELTLEETVTPCPHNPLGVKGVGEAGTIGAPPAIVNAIIDALAPAGVDEIDMPVSRETLWRATGGEAGHR